MFELRGHVAPEALVLSIIAGAPIGKIVGGLGHKSIVRAMPNTPAQIGEGITVWTAAPPVTDEQREMSRQILKALGDEVFMEEETYLDMATALSGTGPNLGIDADWANPGGGCRGASWIPPPGGGAAGGSDGPGIRSVLHEIAGAYRRAAEPGHLLWRDLGGGLVLS